MPFPSDPTAVPLDADSITIAWSAVTEATGYDIERNGIIIATDIMYTTSYTDDGVTLTDEHDYRVRAVFGAWYPANVFHPSDTIYPKE